ncbi:MAG: hypothetical protein ABFS08_09485 [Pseudomonadota bacterium]
MNKKEAAKRKRRKKERWVNYLLIFGIAAVIMLVWSYYLFTTNGGCSYGGSKLSILFAPMCHYFGAKGAAFIPLTLSVLFSHQAWSTYKGGK